MAEEISLAIAESDTPEVREYKTFMWVKAQCEMAAIYLDELHDPNPLTRKDASTHYLKLRNGAITTARTLKDEIAENFAFHEIIKLCSRARDIEAAKKLFREIDDEYLRARIIKDVPELANEKKGRLSDEEKARQAVTINLDGLDRNTIIKRAIKAMQDVEAPQRDIETFKEMAINEPSFEKMLGLALAWAPVRFIKNGQPWVTGDWRRLNPWQRVKRRVSLWGGSYEHPDGDIELDIDEKAGVDPRDDEHVKEAKLDAYIKREALKEFKGLYFFYGALAVALIYNFDSIKAWLLKFLGY
jgi:hypothetical protein